MKRLLATLACCLLLASVARADDYPSRLVTIVVPFAAGSGSDTAARIIGQSLGPRLGQTIVVENRVGATGAIAATYVARAKPDGYTLLLATNSTNGSNSALYKHLTYDPVNDFVGVASTGVFNLILVVNPASPYHSAADVVAAAKADPGKLTYASGSSGSVVLAETFARETGIKILRVAYRSNPPALTDVMAGRVSMMFVDISSASSFVRAGTLRALAVTTKTRSPLYPDLPTIDETVAKGYDLSSWTGLLAPAGTPAPIVDKLNTEVNAVLALPDVRDRLSSLGVEPAPMTAPQFTSFVHGEVGKWSDLVRQAGIEPE